ncbi:MAG: alpha/beta fold hydrolase [Actinomycetes bacterium]
MPEIDGPAGKLHYVITGDGEPTTLFVPGLAQSIADTRSFGSAVEGRRVFVDLRGHGGSSAPPSDDAWTYQGLAADVATVADDVSASRALGVSLGAGALVRLMADEPTRFDRVVLALPGLLTGPRSDAELSLTDALAKAVVDGPGGDPSGTASALVQLRPQSVRGRTDVKLWARRHAAELGGRRGTADAIRFMPRATAVTSLEVLRGLEAQVLVLAQRGDVVHPVESAEALATALPNARLVVSDVPWIWGGRSALRETVSGFLNE